MKIYFLSSLLLNHHIITDSGAKDQTNIKLVRYETKNKYMNDIIHFLKTFILLILSEISGKKSSDEDMLNECNEIFDAMLGDAVAFCNFNNRRGFRTSLRA